MAKNMSSPPSHIVKPGVPSLFDSSTSSSQATSLTSDRGLVSAVATGVTHGVIDNFMDNQSFTNKQGLSKMALSAGSDYAGCLISKAWGTSSTDYKWMKPALSGVIYPLADMGVKVDGRPLLTQFLIQAGASFAGETASSAGLTTADRGR